MGERRSRGLGRGFFNQGFFDHQRRQVVLDRHDVADGFWRGLIDRLKALRQLQRCVLDRLGSHDLGPLRHPMGDAASLEVARLGDPVPVERRGGVEVRVDRQRRRRVRAEQHAHAFLHAAGRHGLLHFGGDQHQLLSRALGGETFKLPFGHHGGNHPVRDELTGKVEITSQNHNFCVDPASLEGRIVVTHRNLNDGTNEGMLVPGRRAFSVQYHPEAGPGPHDSRYLFERFARLIDTGEL